VSEPVEFEYDGIHALPLSRGGQLWVAPWPLCWTIYLVSGRGGFLAVTDPREQGSMVWDTATMDGGFHPIEWWQDYFATHGYKCEGQLRDVELAKWDAILAKYVPQEIVGVRGPAQP
jgi:hypothetical protein